MTGTPASIALATDGLMAVPSWARIDEDVGALGDEVLDVAGLRLGRRLGVVRDVRAAAGLDRRLQRRLVPLRPALLLVVVPGDADDAVAAAAAGCRSAPAAGGRACRRPSVVAGGAAVAVVIVVATAATRTKAALIMSAADRRTCMWVSSPLCGAASDGSARACSC